MKKVSQRQLAQKLNISERRVGQLCEHGIIERSSDKPIGYDLATCEKRYRALVRRDLDRICVEIEIAAETFQDLYDAIERGSSIERKQLAPRVGPAIQNLCGWMCTGAAVMPEAQRTLLRHYVRLEIGGFLVRLADMLGCPIAKPC